MRSLFVIWFVLDVAYSRSHVNIKAAMFAQLPPGASLVRHPDPSKRYKRGFKQASHRRSALAQPRTTSCTGASPPTTIRSRPVALA